MERGGGGVEQARLSAVDPQVENALEVGGGLLDRAVVIVSVADAECQVVVVRMVAMPRQHHRQVLFLFRGHSHRIAVTGVLDHEVGSGSRHFEPPQGWQNGLVHRALETDRRIVGKHLHLLE